MNTSNRPPAPHKKGIAVMQSSKTYRMIQNEQYSSGLRSVRSSSRSRGISMSRNTGIKIDKIYQQKHFPIPSPPTQQVKNVKNIEKTLNHCKSLKLVSKQSETASNNHSIKVDNLPKEGQQTSICALKHEQIVQTNDPRNNSPIGKLTSQLSKLSNNDKPSKLIIF